MRLIITAPDPRLRTPCERVKTLDSSIIALSEELLSLLKSINSPRLLAYGLAGPQLGESVQIFVVATPAIKLIAINPEVTKTYGEHSWIEGCLSLPNSYYKVRRPKLIKFQYLGLDGEIHAAKFHDDYAGVIAHEIDHLSGVCIDTIGTPISRDRIFQS
jgi:peptide deformylase